MKFLKDSWENMAEEEDIKDDGHKTTQNENHPIGFKMATSRSSKKSQSMRGRYGTKSKVGT